MKTVKIGHASGIMTRLVKSTTAATTLFLAASSTWAIAAPKIPPSLAEKVQKFSRELTTKGYEIGRGDFHLFTIEDCKYAIKSIGNCLGNNPTAPYIIPSVPLWPDEFVDSHMQSLLGPLDDKMGWTHRLGEQEALVVMAQLPPSARYFGIQPYIFTRKGELNPRDNIYTTLTDSFMKSILFMSSPNPSRPLVFSSVGDSVNNVVIEKQSGAAFDQQRFFIITSDANLSRQLSDTLLAAGVPDKRQIFTLPIAPSLARLGLSASADDFLTLIRYALPTDELAGETWRQELPLAILRVRNPSPSPAAADPFPMAVRETRQARSELKLTEDTDALVKAVKEQWEQTDAHESQFHSLLLTVDLIGENCLKRPMNCLGDTADADYQISETVGLDAGELIAILGTLGTETANATYTSLSINRLPELVGASNLTDKDLKDSARGFAAKVNNTDKLYLQYYARDCGNLPHCFQVTEQMVPQGADMKIIQRNYVVPQTSRGPDPKQLVNPRMIVLRKNK